MVRAVIPQAKDPGFDSKQTKLIFNRLFFILQNTLFILSDTKFLISFHAKIPSFVISLCKVYIDWEIEKLCQHYINQVIEDCLRQCIYISRYFWLKIKICAQSCNEWSFSLYSWQRLEKIFKKKIEIFIVSSTKQIWIEIRKSRKHDGLRLKLISIIWLHDVILTSLVTRSEG